VLCFKRVEEAFEYRLLHPTLDKIVRWMVEDRIWWDETGEEEAVVTEVWRSQQETERIYAAAGLPAPKASVHGDRKDPMNALSGCRGIDFSVRSFSAGCRSGRPYAEWPFIDRDMLVRLVARINGAWRYQKSEAHQVAVLHDISGLHLHLQVRQGDETQRRREGVGPA
jgi:hypothetical protein